MGTAFALALAFSAGCGRPAHPNVLLITIDTLRADHLGVLRVRGLGRTPLHDRLSRPKASVADRRGLGRADHHALALEHHDGAAGGGPRRARQRRLRARGRERDAGGAVEGGGLRHPGVRLGRRARQALQPHPGLRRLRRRPLGRGRAEALHDPRPARLAHRGSRSLLARPLAGPAPAASPSSSGCTSSIPTSPTRRPRSGPPPRRDPLRRGDLLGRPRRRPADRRARAHGVLDDTLVC